MAGELFLQFRLMLRRQVAAVGAQLLMLGAGLVIFLVAAEAVTRSARYEAWIPDGARVHLVTETFLGALADGGTSPATPGPLAATLAGRFADVVETAARLVEEEAVAIAPDGARLPLTVGLADPAFLAILGRPAVAGDPAAALARPDSLVLAASAARRLFGDRPALGETVEILRAGRRRAMRVSLVMADLPAETHFTFAALMPIAGNVGPDFPYFPDSWFSNHFRTFVKLRPGREARDLARVLEDRLPPLIPPLDYGGRTWRLPDMARFASVPVTSAAYGALVADPGSGWIAAGPARLVIAFALAVLLVAAINYGHAAVAMALETARATAVRKMLGASPARLAAAVLGVTAIQLGVLLAGAGLLAPVAAAAVQQWMAFGSGAFSWRFVPAGALAAVFAMLVIACGFYPALFVARLKPGRILLHAGRQGAAVRLRHMRRLLLALQFAAAAALIAVAAGLEMQARFLIERPVGYDPKGLFAVTGTDALSPAQRATLAREIARIPGVEAVARSGVSPLAGTINTFLLRNPAAAAEESMAVAQVAPAFFSLLGLRVLAGEIPEAFAREEENGLDRPDLPIVINRAARRALGFASDADAVGSTVEMRIDSLLPRRIVAVVADAELFGAFGVRPIVFLPLVGYWEDQILIRSRLPLSELSARVTPLFARIAPDRMLTIQSVEAFLARRVAGTRAEARAATALGVVVVLLAFAGLVAMGRLAFAEFAREAALRRLFGAPGDAIAGRFARRLLPPVLVANLVALPLAAWWLADWLAGQPVRAEPGAAPFVLAFGICLLAAAAAIARPTLAALRLRPVAVLEQP